MQCLATIRRQRHRRRFLLGLGHAVVYQVIAHWLYPKVLGVPAGTSSRQRRFGVSKRQILVFLWPMFTTSLKLSFWSSCSSCRPAYIVSLVDAKKSFDRLPCDCERSAPEPGKIPVDVVTGIVSFSALLTPFSQRRFSD